MLITSQTALWYLIKTRDGRKSLGDNVLLRFRGPINTY